MLTADFVSNVSKPGILGPQPSIVELLAQLNSVAIQLNQAGRNGADKGADLRTAEHAVLQILQRAGSMTVPQIARERSTSRQNIQILVDRLETEGLVKFIDNPAHKRSALVHLTEAGKAWLAGGEEARTQFWSEINSRVSEAEISATLSLLKKLQNLISKRKVSDKPIERALTRVSAETSQRKVVAGSVNTEPIAEAEFPINLL